MSLFISINKNTIAANNKAGWKDPQPPIRIAKSAKGPAVDYGHQVAILDKFGRTVAKIRTTEDGSPLLKCGAKVAIETKYDVRVEQ